MVGRVKELYQDLCGTPARVEINDMFRACREELTSCRGWAVRLSAGEGGGRSTGMALWCRRTALVSLAPTPPSARYLRAAVNRLHPITRHDRIICPLPSIALVVYTDALGLAPKSALSQIRQLRSAVGSPASQPGRRSVLRSESRVESWLDEPVNWKIDEHRPGGGTTGDSSPAQQMPRR